MKLAKKHQSRMAQLINRYGLAERCSQEAETGGDRKQWLMWMSESAKTALDLYEEYGIELPLPKHCTYSGEYEYWHNAWRDESASE